MPYTPRRQFEVCTSPPAKAATVAKAWSDPSPDPPILATVATLAGVGPRDDISPDALAERAAIIEEGAKVPADWADGFARLAGLPVPRGVSEAAWLAMMDAAGRFLDQWGGKAAALGWTAGELFGLDDDAPMNRRDRRVAAFYLVGREVLAVTAEAITLRVGGAVQRMMRRDGLTNAAWHSQN